jgi:class 3 adenylate cyclase
MVWENRNSGWEILLTRQAGANMSSAGKNVPSAVPGRLRHRPAARSVTRPAPARQQPTATGSDGPARGLSPVYRTIVAVDIEGSTTRPDAVKAHLRTVMYELLEAALNICGIAEKHRDPLIDRGDGAFLLVRPVDQAPKTLLLSEFIPTLNHLLASHNAEDPDQLRLRAAIHAGEVNYDRRGCFGETIDLTFRLLDAPESKTALRGASGPLILVVSDTVYQSVVRHGYHGLDEQTFAPLVQVEIAGHQHCGWINRLTAEGSDQVLAWRRARRTRYGAPLVRPAETG